MHLSFQLLIFNKQWIKNSSNNLEKCHTFLLAPFQHHSTHWTSAIHPHRDDAVLHCWLLQAFQLNLDCSQLSNPTNTSFKSVWREKILWASRESRAPCALPFGPRALVSICFSFLWKWAALMERSKFLCVYTGYHWSVEGSSCKEEQRILEQ